MLKCFTSEVQRNQLHGRVFLKDISSFSGFFIFVLAQQVTAKESKLFKMEKAKRQPCYGDTLATYGCVWLQSGRDNP